jgi:hypothetical protein
MFPKANYFPTLVSQNGIDSLITLTIFENLVFPVLLSCAWKSAVFWTAVPKAGIQKHNNSSAAKS